MQTFNKGDKDVFIVIRLIEKSHLYGAIFTHFVTYSHFNVIQFYLILNKNNSTKGLISLMP